MIETEFKTILDREESVAFVSKYYKDALELLKEITNYGSRLIVRVFTQTDRTLKDIVVLLMLLKHSITMIDSIEILLSQGAVIGAKLPLRTLFETHIYLLWCFNSETERKCLQYYVWHLRKKYNNNKRILDGTKENEIIKDYFEKFSRVNLSIYDKNIQDDALKQNEEIEKLLNSDEYRAINQEFDRLKKKRGNREAPWYRPFDGPNSLYDMATRLKLTAEYSIIYSNLSGISHSQSFDTHIRVIDTTVTFENVRDIREIHSVLSVSISFAIRIYRMIIESYIPDEIENFGRKYSEEWRSRFISIPKIEIKDEKLTMI